MKFSIVTPTLNRSPRLACCLASVADQVGSAVPPPFTIEHIVRVKAVAALPAGLSSTIDTVSGFRIQGGRRRSRMEQGMTSDVPYSSSSSSSSSIDSRTKDEDEDKYERASGTDVPDQVSAGGSYARRWVEAPDGGMYDALNRGFAEATGDVFGWLNDDEQYLPGALAAVRAYFESHPSVEALFGDCIFVDENGGPLSYRPALPMRRLFVEAAFLYNFSCALFFRADWWRRAGGFDTTLRVLGDEDLFLRALASGVRCGLSGTPLSAFTFHPDRLSVTDAALEEHLRLKARVPRRRRLFQAPLNLLRLAEKVLRGATRDRRNVEYAVYAPGRTDTRSTFRAERLTTGWPARARLYFGVRDFWKG